MASMVDKNAPLVPIGALLGGRYLVLRQLGHGGMGAVLEAENTWTKRRVAVKVMRPEIAEHVEYARRFMQEARAATQLAHPNIVDVLDMGEDLALGSLYIVQEFLTGHDLRRHLDAAGRMPVRDVLELVLPIMDALATAHACGVVHRDIKPDNIFLAETPRGVVPKLIDFGIAKVAAEDGTSLQKTSMGALMGTPHYMSPEQALGDAGLDARTDVWSIAVVLYEMLSGQRPHESNTNANALIAKIIYEDPRPLAEAAPDLPADLTAAVMGALQRDLTKRHASMRAFVDALRACSAASDAAQMMTAGPRGAEGSSTLRPSSAPTLPPKVDGPRDAPGTIAPRVETLPPIPGTPGAAPPHRTVVRRLAGGFGVAALALGLWALFPPRPLGHPAAPPVREARATPPITAVPPAPPLPAAPVPALAVERAQAAQPVGPVVLRTRVSSHPTPGRTHGPPRGPSTRARSASSTTTPRAAGLSTTVPIAPP